MKKITANFKANKKESIILLILSLMMLYFLLFNLNSVLFIPYKQISGPSGNQIPPGYKPDIAQIYGMWAPWGKASWAFYFTIQSNILVFVYLVLRTFNIIKPSKNKHAKRFQLIVITNITVTFLVYWTILAPIDIIWNTPLKILDTLHVHWFSFLIAISVFCKESLRIYGKNKDNIKLPKKDFWYILIYPVVWLIVAIILYYATRTNIRLTLTYSDGSRGVFYYKFGIAIYPFLAFDIAPVWLPIVSILAIAGLLSVVGSIFMFVSNKEWKKKEKSK